MSQPLNTMMALTMSSEQNGQERSGSLSKGKGRLVVKVDAEFKSFLLWQNVSLIIYDEDGNASKRITVYLHKSRGSQVVVPERKLGNIDITKIAKVEFWCGMTTWCFVKHIQVNNVNFCVFRAASYSHPNIVPDQETYLPQNEKPTERERRKKNLKHTQIEYEFKELHEDSGLPAEVATMPTEEEFTKRYDVDLFKDLSEAFVSAFVDKWKVGTLRTIEDLEKFYSIFSFRTPEGDGRWNVPSDEEKDLVFANQRTNGLNSSVIKLVTELEDLKKIPLTDDMLRPFTITQAIEKKRLFVCDLAILKDIQPTNPELTLCAPIGVFLLDKDYKLKPVAIQLFQEPAEDNPVFVPKDGWNWILAKMWFNNADAAYHQSITHLGFTHLLMEGVSVATHRQLSKRHPIFKMLAPHFLFLIAINAEARKTLINEGGIIDGIMTAGVRGSFEIIRRRLQTWRMDVDGTLPEELRNRGVENTKTLPNYYFRDDALQVYGTIKTYVTDYVKLYYGDAEALEEDWEIQAWVEDLTKERKSQGGCGLKGVPVNANGKLDNVDDLITILTSIIYTCSAGHAAANFAQYDEYGYPPNYPGLLVGHPPNDKSTRSERDVVQALADTKIILRTLFITKVLSEKDTRSLGDFEEVPTITDGRALEVVINFRNKLRSLSQVIKEENETRGTFKYAHLDPEFVPNAISI